MSRPLRIFTPIDLREQKGIRWSRQHRNRNIKAGIFPPPDGRMTAHPQSPPFWFEHTIDRYIRGRAAVMRETRRPAPSLELDRETAARAPPPGATSRKSG